MKKLSILLWSLVISAATQAQSISNHKHEIGMNLGPVAITLMGGFPGAQPLGLYYKHLTEKGAYRLQLMAATQHPGVSSRFMQYREDFSAPDSSLKMLYGSEVGRNLMLWAGREYRVPKGSGWTFTYGFDLGLIFSYNAENFSEWQYEGAYLKDGGSWPRDYHLGNLKSTQSVALRETMGLGMGAQATVGLMKELSPRLYLHLQSGISVFALQHNKTNTDYRTGQQSFANHNEIRFSRGPLLHEIGLYYRL
jgi:hypothetical protein